MAKGKFSGKSKPYFCRKCGIRRFTREFGRDIHEKTCKAAFQGLPAGESVASETKEADKPATAFQFPPETLATEAEELKKQFEQSTGLELPAPEMIEILIADTYDKLANKLQDESIRIQEKDARIAAKAVKVLLDYYVPKFGARPVGLAFFVLLVELGPATFSAVECMVRKFNESRKNRGQRGKTDSDDLWPREVRKDDAAPLSSEQ